jgi:outer membrane receptor protein involved in Fe transport
LLAPCFGSPTVFTPADHNQAYSVAGGILLNNARGGWFSADGEYGTGLSSAICPPGTPGYCEVTPHIIFNLGEGVPIAPHTALTLGIQNVLNDRYYVTLLNAQGNHYAPPRTFTIGVQTGRP